MCSESPKEAEEAEDKHACPATFPNGDRAFTYMPAKTTGKTWKFARPFHDLYSVLEIMEQGATIHPVDDPRANLIWVSMDRVRQRHEELGAKHFQAYSW